MAKEYVYINGLSMTKALDSHKLSKAGVSRALGKSDAYLGNVINKNERIDMDSLKTVCGLMGMPVDQFIVKDEEPKQRCDSIGERSERDLSALISLLSEWSMANKEDTNDLYTYVVMIKDTLNRIENQMRDLQKRMSSMQGYEESTVKALASISDKHNGTNMILKDIRDALK